MNDLEDLVVAEAQRQGVLPNSTVMRSVAIHLAGSSIVDGAILLPGCQSLLPRDYVASLRATMPEGFEPLSAKPTSTGNLTADMKRIVADSRSSCVPHDWDQVRSRMTGVTAKMMDEIASQRKNKP